jgi:hypothetical protein
MNDTNLEARRVEIDNVSSLEAADFASIKDELEPHSSLTQVLAWASTKPKGDVHPQTVAEVITQDEYTHDVIVPYRDVFLTYDTT